jgi:hypothetical protein
MNEVVIVNYLNFNGLIKIKMNSSIYKGGSLIDPHYAQRRAAST